MKKRKSIKKSITPREKKEKTKNGKLTRLELWTAICKKYKKMRIFTIQGSYNHWRGYIHREKLYELLFELQVDKSRHLTKSQKVRLKEEINQRILEKI